MTTTVDSIDPRTAEVRMTVSHTFSADDVRSVCATALEVFEEMRRQPRAWRTEVLRAMADALEASRDEIVAAADAETALGPTRLNGELTRTSYQLRLFAEVVDDGGFLEATIDHAGPTDMGPRPDLRRMLVPLGPVAVFGASNFPLAFSVPGGDTASALAAGCPVVVKVHESHPQTARLCAEALARGATRAGAPAELVQLVFGREAGAILAQDPAITAVGFTGSLNGGQALMRMAADRDVPIPFFGELASPNPLIVTTAAAAERATEIAEGLVGSFTLGAGQFCTKPGIVLVPAGEAGDALMQSAMALVEDSQGAVMLNSGIGAAYRTTVAAFANQAGICISTGSDGGEFAPAPAIFEIPAADLTDPLLHECFGPETVVVRYGSNEELLQALARVPGSLTVSLHVGAGEVLDRGLLDAAERIAGRVLFNGFPTGVAVAWAQHHGGPWPSTNTQHTSVGPTAIRRFLRPMVWQDAPEEALPVELRKGTIDIPRRVNGTLIVAGAE